MTPPWIRFAKRTAVTGTVTSALSLVCLLLVSRQQTGSAAAALNGSSQIVHGDEALRARHASLRHTLPALAVHHLSSHWWAAVQEHPWLRRRLPHAGVRALLVTASAAILDYGLLPRRLSPGYEGQLSGSGMLAVFAAIAAGLALGSVVAPAAARLRERARTRANTFHERVLHDTSSQTARAS